MFVGELDISVKRMSVSEERKFLSVAHSAALSGNGAASLPCCIYESMADEAREAKEAVALARAKRFAPTAMVSRASGFGIHCKALRHLWQRSRRFSLTGTST